MNVQAQSSGAFNSLSSESGLDEFPIFLPNFIMLLDIHTNTYLGSRKAKVEIRLGPLQKIVAIFGIFGGSYTILSIFTIV